MNELQMDLGEQAQPMRAEALLVFNPHPALVNTAACALLAPAIKAKLGEIHSGQVLEVRTGDLSAKDDIEAWCRLSGHTLLHWSPVEGQLHFWIRKK